MKSLLLSFSLRCAELCYVCMDTIINEHTVEGYASISKCLCNVSFCQFFLFYFENTSKNLYVPTCGYETKF